MATHAPRSFGSDVERVPAMPIRFVSGDLFDNAAWRRAFAHGCNCQGSMGAGVAKTFRARYPEMYEEYRSRCKAEPRRFNLGDCWLWKADDQPWVFNLGTQEGYWRSRASYEAIETALKEMQEAGRRRGDHEHRHAPDRRRLRRAVVEEGPGDHRGGVRGLAGHAGRLRGVRAGPVGRHVDRPATDRSARTSPGGDGVRYSPEPDPDASGLRRDLTGDRAKRG